MLYCGDCRDILPNASGHVIATDPPYGINYISNRRNDGPTEAIHDDIIAPIDVVPLMAQAIQPNGAMYLCTRFDVFPVWRQAVTDAGLKVKTTIVWDKGNHTSGDLRGDYGCRTELVLFAHKGRHILRNGRDNNLWPIPRLLTKDHPTPKPPQLMGRMIINSSNIDDVIIDPFMGIGPTGIACIKLRRRFIGIEINQAYFDAACKRIEAELKSMEA